jgi:hypothetical protein
MRKRESPKRCYKRGYSFKGTTIRTGPPRAPVVPDHPRGRSARAVTDPASIKTDLKGVGLPSEPLVSVPGTNMKY